MKRFFLVFFALFLISTSLLAQESIAEDGEYVMVSTDGAEEYISINNIVGYWYNKSAQGTFNAIQSKNEPKYLWVQQGQTVTVNDDWANDYATKLQNTRWHVVGNQLYIYQPEIGLKPVSIERVGKSKNYVLTVNNVEYSRKISLTGVASLRD